MVTIIYVLIGLYAVLTGMAGFMQWKGNKYQVQSFLFVNISIGILVTIFILNKDWMFILLILAFVLLHILTIAEGLMANGQLRYSHHIFRFTFHCILILLVYNFIK